MQKKGQTSTPSHRSNPLLLALVIVLILAVIIGYTRATQVQLDQFARYTVQNQAAEASQEIDAYITSALTSIQLLSSQVEEKMTAPELDHAKDLLASYLPGTPFNFIEYINSQGMNMTDKGEPFNASDRVYYIRGIAGETGVWINYHPKYSDEYLLNFYTPLRYQGSIVGVLTGTLGADTNLLPLLSTNFFGEELIGLICDANGQVIAATLPHARDDIMLPQALTSSGVPDNDQRTFLDHIARQDKSVFTFRSAEGRSIACININEHTGWSVLQVVPGASFNAINRSTSGNAFAAVATMVMLLLFYLGFAAMEARQQHELIIQEKDKALAEQVTLSNTDGLTGLLNRRAYEDDLMMYPKVPPEDDYVYVSIDVNGVKIVNDNLGHAMGDELLLGAVDCFKRCLGGYGRLYRVGGDEFVAQIFANEEHLQLISRDLEDAMLSWKHPQISELAFSYGFASKREFPGMPVVELAKVADERMYKYKSEYYLRKGIDRRGQQTAYAALCATYTKILRVNLTTDSYHIICMDENERTDQMGFAQQISTWLRNFGVSGQVHPDDLEAYLNQTALSHLRSAFAGGMQSLCIFYRRRIGSDYRRAMMELIPADDYTHENQSIYLFVKNIDTVR